MTKVNTELLNKIQNAELDFNEDQMKFITDLLETAGHKSTKKNENYIDEKTGLEMKFCSRHLQYEPISEFKVSKSGKMESCCDVALGQWREYNKILNDLEKLTAEIRLENDNEKLLEHYNKIDDAKSVRAGSYEYPELEK